MLFVPTCYGAVYYLIGSLFDSIVFIACNGMDLYINTFFMDSVITRLIFGVMFAVVAYTFYVGLKHLTNKYDTINKKLDKSLNKIIK